MKYKITEEQIKEAHNAACPQWKQKIESWFSECFKVSLEVGKWYKMPYFNSFIGCIKEYDKERFYYYGLNTGGVWNNNDFYFLRDSLLTPATDEEVESMLKKEAKKRGFKEGVYFNPVASASKSKIKKDWIFVDSVNLLTNDGLEVFNNGKWATIVEQPKEMTLQEIESKLGHKIKIIG